MQESFLIWTGFATQSPVFSTCKARIYQLNRKSFFHAPVKNGNKHVLQSLYCNFEISTLVDYTKFILVNFPTDRYHTCTQHSSMDFVTSTTVFQTAIFYIANFVSIALVQQYFLGSLPGSNDNLASDIGFCNI